MATPLMNRLSPNSAIRKTSSRATLSKRRSAISVRHAESSFGVTDPNEGEAAGRFSLAHELASALSEPTPGSQALADEFALEFDDGAEGIDSIEQPNDPIDPPLPLDAAPFGTHSVSRTPSVSSAGDLSGQAYDDFPIGQPVAQAESFTPSYTDPLELLSRDLDATDAFLSRLRHIDTHNNPSSSHLGFIHESPVELHTSRMIRQLNDFAKEREGQVREMVICEKEFRKIAGEIGGGDALGFLDELEDLLDLPSSVDMLSSAVSRPRDAWPSETDSSNGVLEIDPSDDGESNHGDDVFGADTPPERPRQVTAPLATPSSIIPHLSHMRAATVALVQSLSAISEHAQVNGAATADAGRKLRGLRNRLAGWRADWESAERSREQIERWESGEVDWSASLSFTVDVSLFVQSASGARLDGRKMVEAELSAFAKVLAEANVKTQAIMASR